jgi:plasmid replication initiation protein
MEIKKSIVQPNVITSARYDYTVIEKRIVYHIIKHIQDKMGVNINANLFGEPYLRIPLSELVEHDNYKQIRVSARLLAGKIFEINQPNGGWLMVGFISSAQYLPNENVLRVGFSPDVIPYIVELAKGFTQYELNVALNLKSPYSQRFYEFCAQFRNTGIWRISVADLKSRLMLDDSTAYNGRTGNGNLKTRILEKSKKEIKALYDKGDCDFYFTYTFKKTGKTFTDLEFKIYSTKNPKHEPEKEQYQQLVHNFFTDHFRNDYEENYVKRVMNGLFNKNAYSSFYAKIHPKLEQFIDLHISHDELKKLARHILKADFQLQ